MAKQTQTIRLSVFGHFLGLTIKGLKEFRKGLSEDIFTEIKRKSLALSLCNYTVRILLRLI